MNDNKIFLEISRFLGQGKQIESIEIDNKITPTKLFFVFEDKSEETVAIGPKDSLQFAQWWKQACCYLRVKWTKVRKNSN